MELPKEQYTVDREVSTEEVEMVEMVIFPLLKPVIQEVQQAQEEVVTITMPGEQMALAIVAVLLLFKVEVGEAVVQMIIHQPVKVVMDIYGQ
jgi:hypothetical protein